jgi:hypothetical protein
VSTLDRIFRRFLVLFCAALLLTAGPGTLAGLTSSSCDLGLPGDLAQTGTCAGVTAFHSGEPFPFIDFIYADHLHVELFPGTGFADGYDLLFAEPQFVPGPIPVEQVNIFGILDAGAVTDDPIAQAIYFIDSPITLFLLVLQADTALTAADVIHGFRLDMSAFGTPGWAINQEATLLDPDFLIPAPPTFFGTIGEWGEQPVSTPSTIVLFGLGLAALGRIRRKRSQHG